MVTGRVDSGTTSAVNTLDASAKSLDDSAKCIGLVGGVLVASAAPSKGFGKGTVSATIWCGRVCSID